MSNTPPIQRYDNDYGNMDAKPYGDWVRWSDIEGKRVVDEAVIAKVREALHGAIDGIEGEGGRCAELYDALKALE